MKKLISLLLNLFLLTLVGCAQTKVSKKPESNKELSRQEILQFNMEAAKRVSGRLEELTVAAKASGPEKVRFLASDMYLKASAALMEGDYQTANLIFKHLLSLEPNDDFVKQKYAISLIRTGDIEESQKLLEEIFKNSKKSDPKIGLVLAGVYASLGKIAESRKVYEGLIKLNPRQEEACVFLAKSFALDKQNVKAIKLLKECEARDKGKGIYSYYMGKIYVDKKQFKIAQKYFKASLVQQGDFSQAVMALGIISEELNQFDDAKQLYVKYLKQNPNDTLILNRLVQLLFTKEDFKGVIEYAERLSDFEPDNLNLKVKLAILYKDTKQFDKSITIFKELLTFAPDNDQILYYLAGTFQEIKDYENAIEYFSKINTTSGLYQDSSFQIAQMLSYMAKDEFYKEKTQGPFHKKFLTYINSKIKEIESFKVEFSVVKAAYFESLEENNEAIHTLEYVRDDKTFSDEHRFYLAALFEKAEEFSKAVELVEEILENDPKNAHAWNFLGYSMLERGEKYNQAFEYINKAIKLKPADGYIRDSLGWYYFKIGKIDLALKELKSAVKLVPDDVSINKHIAIVYSALKDFKNAQLYLKRAITSVQNEAERKELFEALKDLENNRVPASFDPK